MLQPALKNEHVCFVGIGLPSAACNLARLTHAPQITLIYESGTIRTRPHVLPLSIGDGELCDTALTTVSVPEMFRYWLQAQRINIGFLTGAQVDCYGNLNSTVIGSYDHPKVRLPGSGGASEIATSCNEIFIIMRQSRKAFVPKLHFLTSLGHGRDGRERKSLCLRTKGPTLLITDLCVMRPDPETSEFTVTSLHHGVSPDEVRENSGWPIRFAEHMEGTESPTSLELTTLRELHARTTETHGAQRNEHQLMKITPYRRPDPETEPPSYYPPYRATVSRSPQKPLILLPHTLSEVTGPMYGHDDIAAGDNDLTRQHAGEPIGERIIVSGQVLDAGGHPARNTLIEIWQANSAGRNLHHKDDPPAPLDPNFTGAGRTLTDENGFYQFVTIKPGAYPWRNHENAWRPAHIHFSLFGPAFVTRLITQMYFPGNPLFAYDPIFQSIPDEKARERLISKVDLEIINPEWALGFRFDIILRGRESTPFES